MTRPWRSWAIGAVLCSGSPLACGDPDALPSIRYETDRVRVGTGYKDPLCAADLAFLDRQVEFVETMTGARRDGPIDVFVYDDPDSLPCHNSIVGCYNRDRDFIAALWPFVDHELVHAVTRAIDLPSTFWNEGTAVALSIDGTHRGQRGVLDEFDRSDDVSYTTAGHFVRFLYENSEVAPVDILTESFARPMAELSAQYEAGAPYAYPPWEPCPFPELANTGPGVWEEELSFSCSDDEATATEWSGASIVRRLTLEEPGIYEVTMTGGAGVLMVGCQIAELSEPAADFTHGDLRSEAEAGQTAPGTFFHANQAHRLNLTEGVYRLALSLGRYEQANVRIQVFKL